MPGKSPDGFIFGMTDRFDSLPRDHSTFSRVDERPVAKLGPTFGPGCATCAFRVTFYSRCNLPHYCTVSVKVVVCFKLPLVATTVTVEVVAGVVICALNLIAPPQPVHKQLPIATSANSIWRPRHFFQPKQKNATASTVAGNRRLELLWRVALAVEVVTESNDEAVPPDGIRVSELKLHEAPEGNPEQLSDTGKANEFTGVTETVTVPLFPAVTASDPGETASVNPGVGRLIV